LVSKFNEELANAAPRERFQLFRRHGVVNKLHNFMNAVCVSHKRRELFLTVQRDLADDDTYGASGPLIYARTAGLDGI
jgi:hypothetical protein